MTLNTEFVASYKVLNSIFNEGYSAPPVGSPSTIYSHLTTLCSPLALCYTIACTRLSLKDSGKINQ